MNPSGFQTCFPHQRRRLHRGAPAKRTIPQFPSNFNFLPPPYQIDCNHMGYRRNDGQKCKKKTIKQKNHIEIINASQVFPRWHILTEWVKMTGHSNDIDSESNQNMNFGQTWFSLMASPRQRGLIGSSGAFLKRSSELDEKRKSVRSRSVSILLDEKIKLSEADPYWDFLDILLKFRSFTTQAQILYLV